MYSSECALGAYGLNAIILKHSAHFICEPFDYLINKCIETKLISGSC